MNSNEMHRTFAILIPPHLKLLFRPFALQLTGDRYHRPCGIRWWFGEGETGNNERTAISIDFELRETLVFVSG
jgi:hypothetical protein